MAVIIIGAGIGGLTLALALHKAGIHTEIHEASRELRPLGVGVNVPPHAAAFLHELGLGAALAAAGLPTSQAIYFNKFGQRIWGEPRGLAAGYPVPQYSIHRGELQMILLRAVRERLGHGAVHLGHRLVRIGQDADRVTAHFVDRLDGERARDIQADALIAADGIHSVVRAQLYPDEGEPIFAGRLMWRGAAEAPPYLDGHSMIWFGHASQKFMCYPMSAEAHARGRSLINFVATRRVPEGYTPARSDWNRIVAREEILAHYAGWNFGWVNPEQLLANAPALYEFPMVDRDPLPRWSHGRATLLGDAAHPMYPAGSNGAAQAIIDARELARRFAQGGTVENILLDYDALRRPATAEVVRANRGDGPDRVLQMAEDRAPQGFRDIQDVIPRAELEAISRGYKQTAGFDIATVQRIAG